MAIPQLPLQELPDPHLHPTLLIPPRPIITHRIEPRKEVLLLIIMEEEWQGGITQLQRDIFQTDLNNGMTP